MDRNVRSRTGSTSLPSAPSASSGSRVFLNSSSSLSPDQLSTGIFRARSDSSRSSSIPTTPAPTPLLQVSHHMHPEQLAAGIKQLKADEGYIDSTSLPGTPTPSPFSPSPAQFSGFSPDQIAEGIKRLREESAMSGTSTGQPPTPSTTPGPSAHIQNQQLGIIPEHLVESIRQLHCDEGLESGSNPATPVPTPTTGSLRNQQSSFPPEQLAAGIHRLKTEEGMSSGGSSGFPSTPAPTPFSHLPGGVLPEDLAAGISRLSVIEEAESGQAPTASQQQMPTSSSETSNTNSISKYFDNKEENVFDNLETAVLASCRESRINLPDMESTAEKPGKAEIQIEQTSLDKQDLKVCQLFRNDDKKTEDPFDEIERPSTLPTASPSLSSTYGTPTAPTPVIEPSPSSYSTYSKDVKAHIFNPSKPITSPFPNGPPSVNPINDIVESSLSAPILKIEDIDDFWIPNPSTSNILKSLAQSSHGSYSVDKSLLTTTNIIAKEEVKDPIKILVTHFHGPSEAAKRSTLPNADSVSQDLNGLKSLIQSECYRSAVTLCGKLLESNGQDFNSTGKPIKHNPTSLQIWFIRIALLIKLNLANKAEAEARPFGSDGDKPDLYYEFYPEDYPFKSGPMISFSFRLLLAQIPHLHGKSHETLDRLYALWDKIKKIRLIIGNNGTEFNKNLWRKRELKVVYTLINSYLAQNDYALAVETITTLYEMEDEKNKANVRSMQGRIFLQLGDVDSARISFEEARKLRNPKNEQDKYNNLIDESFVAIGNNSYEEAITLLQEARAISNSVVVNNNMSLCLLPLGRLSESLSLLETNLTRDPGRYQFEIPILNLTTLYDLESSYVGQKRQRLLGLIGQYKGDGFNPSCLQLQS